MAVADVSAAVVVVWPTLLDASGFSLRCTQFGFQEDGAPAGQPSIASRVVTQEWGLVIVLSCDCPL